MIYNQSGTIEITYIKKLLHLLHFTTGVPVKFINQDLENIYTLDPLTNKSPLVPWWHMDSKSLLLSLEKSQLLNQSYFYQNTFSEYYILFAYYSKSRFSGMLSMGPMLTAYPKDQHLMEILSKHNLPLSNFDDLKAYFSQQSLVASIQLQYFEQLVSLLSKYPIETKGVTFETHIEPMKLDKLPIHSNDIEHHPYELEKELHRAMFEPDFDQVSKSTLNIFRNFPKPSLCHNNPLRSTKNHFICSCTNVCRAAINAGLDSNIAFSVSDQFINQVELLETINEVDAYFTLMRESYQTLVQKHQRDSFSPPVALSKKYIKENVCAPLTLQEVSEAIGYSSKYLSDIFYKEVGQKFKHYVNIQKIELALTLLKIPNTSITDVSQHLSYCNPSYFGKVFKEHMNVSPLTYVNRQHPNI